MERMHVLALIFMFLFVELGLVALFLQGKGSVLIFLWGLLGFILLAGLILKWRGMPCMEGHYLTWRDALASILSPANAGAKLRFRWPWFAPYGLCVVGLVLGSMLTAGRVGQRLDMVLATTEA